MFLDPLVNRAASSLANYPDVLGYLTDARKFTKGEINSYRLGHTAVPFLPLSNDPEEDDFREVTRNLFFLKNRVIIPLENSVGLVNGLITRSLEKETKFRYGHYYLKEAKQIGAFFGLRQALPHILAKGVVYVTEGAFDCISIARHFPNTVSTLTSNINEEQMFTLRMIADNIVMVFDPDKAGREGVQSVFTKFGRKGIYSREFGHKDPNAYLVKHGDEAFKKALSNTLGSLALF